MNDPVNHPGHYCDGRKYEPIDVIEDWELNYCLGNVVKYVSRAGRKGDALEDLKKARFYLNREIDKRIDEELKPTDAPVPEEGCHTSVTAPPIEGSITSSSEPNPVFRPVPPTDSGTAEPAEDESETAESDEDLHVFVETRMRAND